MVKFKTLIKHFNGYGLLVCVAFAGVIIWPQVAFSGAASGLKLWAMVVLPGLLPALIATSCILEQFPMKSGYAYLYVMMTGILCGFPVGAFLCGILHKRNPKEKITNQLMAFCNLSSPSFILNYIIASCIVDSFNKITVLLCIYLPVAEALIFMLIKHRKEIFMNNSPIEKIEETDLPKQYQTMDAFAVLLDNSIWNSIKSMLKLGGYIVIFSCFSAYICMLPMNQPLIKSILCGITEITNGIYLISTLNASPVFRLILIVVINAFGGISTIMQTAGITKGCQMNIKKYIYYKFILAILTLANTLFIIYVL